MVRSPGLPARACLRWGHRTRQAPLRAVVCALGALLSLAAVPVFAATSGGGDEPAPTTTYFEQGILIRSGEVVKALGPDLMGDAINEYSGGLEFTQTDVSLPHHALEVQVGRHKAVGTIQAYAGSGLFGDWDLDI